MPNGTDSQQGGHLADSDPLPTFLVDPEGELHDEGTLPHMHSKDDIDRFFPQINAAPEQRNVEDWVPEFEDKKRDEVHRGDRRRDFPAARRGLEPSSSEVPRSALKATQR